MTANPPAVRVSLNFRISVPADEDSFEGCAGPEEGCF